MASGVCRVASLEPIRIPGMISQAVSHNTGDTLPKSRVPSRRLGGAASGMKVAGPDCTRLVHYPSFKNFEAGFTNRNYSMEVYIRL